MVLMMTALNTWHANAHFTAQSHPHPRGRALVRRVVATVKGASATARRWPLPTSPTSISSLDRSVQQHIATHTARAQVKPIQFQISCLY